MPRIRIHKLFNETRKLVCAQTRHTQFKKTEEKTKKNIESLQKRAVFEHLLWIRHKK